MTAKTSKLPFPIEDMDAKTNEELNKDFSYGTPSFVQIGPKKMVLLSKYRRYAEDYYNFKVRSDDIFIMGFSRSGTQLTQETAWLIINDVNFQKANQLHPHVRIPYLESHCVITDKALEEEKKKNEEALQIFTSALDVLPKMKERRVIKTHLHFDFLPPNLLNSGCKILYVLRNPKDVIVSFYHLKCKGPEQNFVGGFEKFFDYFVEDKMYYTPYWAHIQQAWELRDHPNIHFVYYEEFTQNLRKNVVEMAKFLGKDLSNEQVNSLVDNLGIEKFRKYMSAIENVLKEKKGDNDGYIRKGKVGDWRNYFTPEMNARANAWIEENVKRIGIKYPFDIFN